MSAVTERAIAIREAHEVASCDEFFQHRKQLDCVLSRRLFEDGFRRGWDAALSGRAADPEQPPGGRNLSDTEIEAIVQRMKATSEELAETARAAIAEAGAA